jgi:hypothetical protein
MTRSTLSKQLSLQLRAGDRVVIRSPEEILATLDSSSRLDGLPFQPEMFKLCGREFRVQKTAHKTCDSSPHCTGGRRMHDTVHLEGARCDGALHQGCQADCVFFWKEAWLRRTGAEPALKVPARKAAAPTAEDVLRAAQAPGSNPTDPTWVCQTTAVFEASEPLAWWDIRQYVQDVAGGNHSLWHMAKLFMLAGYRQVVNLGVAFRFWLWLYNGFQKLRGGKPFPHIQGQIAKGQPTPAESLNLQPGEWVVVKSPQAIAATITPDGFNRGMRYDPEMLKYSNERYRVQARISKLINEKNGKMVEMKTPCIQLENVFCRAEFTPTRLGCPRASSTYWREIWLQKEAPQDAAKP